MRVTERAQHAVMDARQEAGRLGHDRVGTEHLLLGLLRDERCLAVAALGGLGISPETVRRRVEESVGARVLHQLGAGLLELREAVAARYAAGVDPEPLPPDRGPPLWEPPPSARLRRVIPLAREYPLPSGDRLVLLSLEVWSDWFDLRYAVVYATPEPEGELPRPAVIGSCQASDRAGTDYTNRTSSHPGFGMVRIHQRTFEPSPPAGAELLELRFSRPGTMPGEAPPLIVSTVDLR